MSNEPPRKWQVKTKYGNKPVTVNVTTPTRQSAEEYARFLLRERGSQPIEILETVEKRKKGKKP